MLEQAVQVINNPSQFAQKILHFNPLPYQTEFLNSCKEKNRILGLWARQSGKSTTLAVYALWHALKHEKSSILIISPTQEQSNLLFDKVRLFVESSEWTRPLVTTQHFDKMIFWNGSEIKSLPVGSYGTSIRGHTADLIILEESGYIKDSIINEVILPMGAAKKNLKIIQIGTPRGRNHFFEATTNKNYAVHHYDYTIPLRHGLFTQSWIDEQKSTLTDIEFKTEYGAEFIEDVDSYFKQSLLQSCIEDYEMIICDP